MALRESIAALTFLLLSSVPSLADSITNGGFETGSLWGWTYRGDADVITNAFAGTNGFPTTSFGNYETLITNIGGLDVRPGAYEALCVQTSSCGDFDIFAGGPSVNALNNLGMAAYGMTPLGASVAMPVISGIQQTFTGNAGDLVTFNWDYLTNETLSGQPLPFDLAFVQLDNQLVLLADSYSATLAVAGTSPPFLNESGYQSFATTLTSTGSHTLTIGVINTVDSAIASGVLIDNLAITSLPEPTTWVLFASGLFGLGLVRRRSAEKRKARRRQHNRRTPIVFRSS